MTPITRHVYRRVRSDPSSPTSPSTLRRTEETFSPTSAHSVVIQVRSVSLNYRDANMLHGTNPWAIRADGIPCGDAAGTVVAIGPEVTRFRIGDRVSPVVDQRSVTGHEQSREWLGGEVDGVLATHVAFDEEHIVAIPDHLSFAEAACLPVAGLTAWSSIVGEGIISGKTVLTQGTGGVSLMVIKLALACGCRVILTSSSDAKLAKVVAAEKSPLLQTVNYKTTPDWHEEAVRLNGGRGVDIVVENGGTSSLLQSMRATAKRGVISQVGYLGNQRTEDLAGLIPMLIDKTINLRGINVGSRLEQEQMNRVIEATQLRFDSVIDREYAFEDAPAALEYLWSGAHVGKIIINLPEHPSPTK